MKNYYQILGVQPTATEAEIKSKYRVLAKRYHPDVNPGDASAASKFADINEAHAVLSDPKSRAEYDAKLKEASAPRPSQEDIIARQRAQAQAAARQAAYRNMNMNMNGASLRAQAAAAQAAAQAQAHAQAQAQVQALCNQAYRQGVAEAQQAAEAEISKIMAALNEAVAENKKLKAKLEAEGGLKERVKDTENDRRELEQELFNRDQELAECKERISYLENEVTQLRKRVGTGRTRSDNTNLQNELDSVKATLKALERDHNALTTEHDSILAEYAELEKRCRSLETDNKQYELKNSAQIKLQQDKRRQLQDEIEELNRKIAELNAENEALRAENEQWLQYAGSEDFLSDAEQRIEAWNKKVNADKRRAKTTLYGDLGVLIWATDEQIAEAHAKLVKKLSGKKDEALVAKLQKAEEAFAVLSDPQKRAEYNASIDITDERIAEERRLIAENEALIEEYREKLANKEFWQRFDELTESAAAGDAQAQFTLGEMYFSGDEIDYDYDQAVFYFKEAAKQKHADAMYYLGVCYVEGKGLDKNENTGNGFIRQAAKLGSKLAQTAVDKMNKK